MLVVPDIDEIFSPMPSTSTIFVDPQEGRYVDHHDALLFPLNDAHVYQTVDSATFIQFTEHLCTYCVCSSGPWIRDRCFARASLSIWRESCWFRHLSTKNRAWNAKYGALGSFGFI